MINNCQQSHEHLQNEWRKLRDQWRTTCELWRDETQASFEQETWMVFTRAVPELEDAIATLGEALAVARRECP